MTKKIYIQSTWIASTTLTLPDTAQDWPEEMIEASVSPSGHTLLRNGATDEEIVLELPQSAIEYDWCEINGDTHELF